MALLDNGVDRDARDYRVLAPPPNGNWRLEDRRRHYGPSGGNVSQKGIPRRRKQQEGVQA